MTITKLKLDKSRKAILERKNRKGGKGQTLDNLAGVD